jgi:hypothetical protein
VIWALKSLRSSVVSVVRVGEFSGLQVGDLDREFHCSVGCNDIAILGASENSRDHAVRRRDFSHS